MLAETDNANNITRYYIYELGLLAMATPAGETYTYHYNGIGSTIAISDSSTNIVNKYSYTPFGIITSQEEIIPQPFKYVGQYGVMSEANGLYYMRARYYDPDVGRFISEDPIGFGGGVNLYAYAGDNPINLVDPLGLKEQVATYSSLSSPSIVDTIFGVSTAYAGETGTSAGQTETAASIKPNWNTVGIGVATLALGVGTITGGIIAGTAISVSGIGFYAAAATVVNGLTFSAIGIGDIFNGLTGGESVLYDFIKGFYSPDLSTAVNPF